MSSNSPSTTPAPQPEKFLDRFAAVLRMIKFQHTIFAMPFALLGGLLAAWSLQTKNGGDGAWHRNILGWPLVLIVLCCVFARSAAMAFNRLADEKDDALNPRTKNRELPQGVLSRRFVWLFTVGNCVGFIACAGLLNMTALAFSPLVLLVLLGYSYTKRFTVFCHFFLGLALGMAPAGAWVAIQASLAWPPVVLGLAVLCWTAGFDIIYACQDYEFDRRSPHLHSLPKSMGLRNALRLAALLHIAAFGLFASMLLVEPLGIAYGVGVAAAAALLIYEHSIISPDDLSRVNAAFFTANGALAIVLLLAGISDALIAMGQSG